MASVRDNDPVHMSYDNDDSIEDDEIVAELDVYSCSNVLPPTAPAYLLQFPQRTQRRPYEGVKDVRFKPKVKRLQWSVPLDTQAATYNSDVDQPMQLQSFTLQSDRIDPGMQGLAVAMRRGSRLYLVPVQEVLQLRHSPVYLDAKEKEAPRRAAGGGGPEALSGIETKPAELPPITVQVKKHETEQQTEARLRSYAFHAQQEEADMWIDMRHHARDSPQAKSLLEALPKGADGSAPPRVTHDRSTYLDAITPGPSVAREGAAVEVDTVAAGRNGPPTMLGQPASALGAVAGQQLASDALAALPNALRSLFDASPVLSLENLRALLLKLPTSGTLNHTAATASDAVLHAAIMGAGDYLCIRKTYTKRLVGNVSVDSIRTIVLELLQDKEQLRRSDVVDAATARGIAMTDGLYQKVMKELCSSRGSVWSLKAGG